MFRRRAVESEETASEASRICEGRVSHLARSSACSNRSLEQLDEFCVTESVLTPSSLPWCYEGCFYTELPSSNHLGLLLQKKQRRADTETSTLAWRRFAVISPPQDEAYDDPRGGHCHVQISPASSCSVTYLSETSRIDEQVSVRLPGRARMYLAEQRCQLPENLSEERYAAAFCLYTKNRELRSLKPPK